MDITTSIIIVLVTPLVVVAIIDRYYKSNGYNGLIHYIKSSKSLNQKYGQNDEIDEFIEREWEMSGPKGQSTTTWRKHMRLLMKYESEVNNGGHDQYFFNSAGDQWEIVKQAIEIYGNGGHRDNFLQALKHFPKSHPSRVRSVRQIQLQSIKPETFQAQDEYIFNNGLHNLYREIVIKNSLVKEGEIGK